MKTKKNKKAGRPMKVKKKQDGKIGKHKIGRKKTPVKNSGEEARVGKYKYTAKKLQGMSLKDRMWEKLKSSRFRYINEQLYNMNGRDAMSYFKKNTAEFMSYHEGYRRQVEHWPVNPLDVIIKKLKVSAKPGMVVADFGCGEAALAKSMTGTGITVHSFDLVSVDPFVTACDIAHTPLPDASVDIGVFCLSLMGTNFADFIVEANRVLKPNGVLMVAEVESRFENVDEFITSMSRFGFKTTRTNFSHSLFYFIDLKKQRHLGKNSRKNLPSLTLHPCLYKKR